MSSVMDHKKNFTKVFSAKLYLHKNITDENIRLMFFGRQLCILDAQDVVHNTRLYADYARVPKTMYADNNLRFGIYSYDTVVYPYGKLLSMEQMKNERLVAVKEENMFLRRKDFSSCKIWVELERKRVEEEDEWYIVYYINDNIIKNIYEGKRETLCSTLVNFLQKDVSSKNKEECTKELSKIMAPSEYGNAPSEYGNAPSDPSDSFQLTDVDVLVDEISLYEYQKRDIQFMKDIEKRVVNNENILDYAFSPVKYVLNDKLVIFNDTILPEWLIAPKIKNCHDNIIYKGGNLVSEMGLGKTIVALTHVLEDLKDDPFHTRINELMKRKETCHYLYKRGKAKGKMCDGKVVDTGRFYCKQHADSTFYDKSPWEFVDESALQMDELIYNKRFKSCATLIVCPNHLCDQWINEYMSKFKGGHNIVMAVTRDQFSYITLGDLLFADIVITSYGMLTNEYPNNSADANEMIAKHNRQDNTGENERGSLFRKDMYGIFPHMHWKRIILDEVHEIRNMPKSKSLIEYLRSLTSTYKWNITGTPFANGLDGLELLMSMNTTTGNGKQPEMHTNYIGECAKLFRRNTRESIKAEFEGNVIREHLKLLEFTDQERAIYKGYEQNSKAYNFLIQICCHTELFNDTREMIKNCKTFEEIQQVLVDHNKRMLDIYEEKIKLHAASIEQISSEIERSSDEEEKETLRMRLGNVKKSHTAVKKNFESTERTYNYLKNTMESLKSNMEKESCPICLDEIETEKLTITKCGHRFCADCIGVVTKDGVLVKCPQCNGLLTKKDVYLFKKEGDEESIPDENDVAEIIKKVKSTKVGHIVHFLKNLDKNDKVIVFSQWDDILRKVGNILSEYKLKHVFCNGTVYQRKGAIKKFVKDDDLNIIMLSSQNAASGINLTNANKIILLEPVYGTAEYRESIEAQAIGRADRIGQKRPIDVYRFIIKNTIEQDIINNVQGTFQMEMPETN